MSLKRCILLSLALILFSFNFILAFSSDDFELYNSTISNSYQIGNSISGILNLSASDVSANSYLESNLGGKIKIIDLLLLNDIPVSCREYGCSEIFETDNDGQGYGSIENPANNYLGFAIKSEKDVSITNIFFNISSNFGLSKNIPLKLNFFDSLNWSWETVSNNFTSGISFGCYDDQSPIKSLKNLRDTEYCEKITNLQGLGAYKVGAKLKGTGTELMQVRIENQDGDFGEDYSCTFDADTDEECLIEFDKEEIPQTGDYFICIKSKDNNKQYEIYSENNAQDKLCGYYGGLSENDQTEIDYALFIKMPYYASSDNMKLENDFFDDFPEIMNNYAKMRYPSSDSSSGADCSKECVFPISVSGTNQIFNLSSLSLEYDAHNGAGDTNLIFNVSDTPPKIKFNGSLEISLANLSVKKLNEKKLILTLDGEKIYESPVEVILAASINDLEYESPIAGFSTEFKIITNSSKKITKYVWDFGDGTSETTTVNKIKHIYKNVTTFDLKVSVTNSDKITSFKIFKIFAKSPGTILNKTIKEKKDLINNFTKGLKDFNIWEKEYIKKLLNLQDGIQKLNYLEKERKTTASDSKYVQIALELNKIIIPTKISKINEVEEPLFLDSKSINPEPLRKISSKEGEGTNQDYSISISEWQRKNINGTLKKKKFKIYGDDEKTFLIDFIDFEIYSNAENKSYIIFDDENLQSNIKFQKKEGYSYLALSPKEKKKFTVGLSDEESLITYVAPDISELNYNMPVEACNHDLVCGPGENYKNCRSDCKPFWKTLIFLIILIFLSLMIYTIIQGWYTYSYESRLFQDHSQLYNLVNYVDNMTVRRKTEGEIRKSLSRQGWSQEKINYAIKKSKGRNTGMFELIPIHKLIALSKRNKAKRDLKNNPNKEHFPPRNPRFIGTPFKQQQNNQPRRFPQANSRQNIVKNIQNNNVLRRPIQRNKMPYKINQRRPLRRRNPNQFNRSNNQENTKLKRTPENTNLNKPRNFKYFKK